MWLYHIRFSSAKETFEKIGITKRSPQERFSSQFYQGFELTIIHLIRGTDIEIKALEKYLLVKNIEHKYTPMNENFSGKTECFLPYTINIKNSDKGVTC